MDSDRKPRVLFFLLVMILTVCVYMHISDNKSISMPRSPSIVETTTEKQIFDIHDCKAEMKRLNAEAVQQDDPQLVHVIQQCFLEAPSNSPYKLKQPNRKSFSQVGQDVYVGNLINHAENGFFVESGAYDGETFSNTLLFEKNRQWTGLLIEPMPGSYKSVKSKNRKSFCVNACLSKSKHPVQMVMHAGNPVIGRLSDEPVSKYINGQRGGKFVVQCFPFYSLMLAVGRTKIDFVSLDIEGDELTVLKTIPWQTVDIKMLIVEHAYIKEGVVSLINFMASNDYIALPQMSEKAWYDVIFVQNNFRYNSSFTYLKK